MPSPSTPPRSSATNTSVISGNSNHTHTSSPRNIPPYHAEHIRDNVAWANAMYLEICKMKSSKMTSALTGGEVAMTEAPKLNCRFKTFHKDCNRLSKLVCKRFNFPEPLLFLYTETVRPAENPVASLCRPDYVAYLEPNLTGRGVSWPWMEAVGEKASKGDSDPLRKTLSYLHYWLLARPERKAGVAFLVSLEGVTFFIGYQGNTQVQSTVAKWGSSELRELMFALVYHLYCPEPSTWVNAEYVRKSDGDGNTVFDIKLNVPLLHLKDFKSVYSRTPFDTRTHVLVNPQSEAIVEGKLVRVVKDELARTGTRFTEKEVYERIHQHGPVPGVAQPCFHHIITDTLHESRERRLTGLQEYGHHIMMAKTVGQVLEIVFDALELTRYLYVRYQVLHRDISRGNVMFVETPISHPKSVADEHKDLCFARHLLDSENHPDPLETCVLLIDFNHGEILDMRQDEVHKRTTCTGTPGFVACAVQKGSPLDPPKNFTVDEIPDAPAAYQARHPERYDQFSPIPPTMYISPKVSEEELKRGWRHDLDHEAESIFWVLVYWLMAASPTKLPKERIGQFVFSGFTGINRERHSLVFSSAFDGLAHSYFNPVIPLIKDMAAILRTDRFWLPKDDPRKHPEYISEALQRVVLAFLEQHRDDKFMSYHIDPGHPRIVENRPQVVTISYTPGQRESAELFEQQRQKRKRDPDSQPREDDQSKKLRPNETSDSSDDTVESLREPENAFPDEFVDAWTAEEDTHVLRFEKDGDSGQVVALLVKLSPKEVAGQGQAG
ncbi:hypothetical protein MD484_g2085, partial [Candolleomyces efflorescens]